MAVNKNNGTQQHPFESTFGDIPIPIAVLQKRRIVYVNRAVLNLFQYDDENDLLRSGLKKLITPESNKILLREEKHHFDETALVLQLQAVTKPGTLLDVEISFSSYHHGAGDQQVVTFRDITKQSAEVVSLRSQTRIFLSLFNQSPVPQVIVHEGAIVHASPAMYRLFAISGETDLVGKQIVDFLDPERVSEFQQLSKKILSGKVGMGSFHHKAYRGNGEFFDCLSTLSLLHIEEEKKLLIVFRDITTDVAEKDDLVAKASEWSKIDDLISSLDEITDLAHLSKKLPDRAAELTHFHHYGFFLVDSRDTKLEIVTPRGLSEGVMEKISDLPLEEGIGAFVHKTLEPYGCVIKKYPSFLPYRSLFHDAGITKIVFIPLVGKGKLFGLLLLATKNAETALPSQHLMNLLSKHGGETLARVLAYEKLKHSERDYKFLVETTPIILYRLSSGGAFEMFNSGVEKLTGYTIREFLRTQSLWLSLVHPDDKKFLLERQTNLSQLSEPITIEYRIRPKGKAAYHWLRDTLVPVPVENEANQFVGTIVEFTSYQDHIEELISTVERQYTEQQLSDSSQLLRNVIDTMEDVLVVTDLEGTVLQTNAAFEKVLGYSFEQAATYEFPQPWLNIEQTGKYVLWMSDLKASETLYDFDMMWKTAQGKLLDMSICSTILCGPEGSPSAVITVARDITERKGMAKELEERNNQLELFNRIMVAAVHSYDFDEIFHKLTQELRKIISFDDISIALMQRRER